MIRSSLPAYLVEDISRIAETMGISIASTTKLIQGERRNVAILFLDLKGFTSLAESLDFEAVHQIINRVMQTLSEIVIMCGGYVDKLEGDKIMALFGAKQASDNDSVRAVDCAIRMLSAVEEVSNMLVSLKIETGARVGISYGQVIVAPDASGHLTATGDVVNVASRLESEAVVGTVMVSGNVRKESGELFRWTDLGEVFLKGRTSPVHAWRPEGAGAERVERWERSARISGTPFLGRVREIQFLHDSWEHFRKKQNVDDYPAVHTVIEICGEAGIGKSRIVHEFLYELSDVNHPPAVLSGCTRTHSQPPLWLWTTLLDNAVRNGNYSGTSREQYKSYFAYIVEKTRDTESRAGLIASIPFLENLLSIDNSDSSLNGMDDKALRKETMLAIRKFLEAAASIETTVVVLEDVHWIDNASSEVLEFLLSGLSLKNPVFFLLVHRPVEKAEIIGRFSDKLISHKILELSLLEDADSSLIVRNMLNSDIDPETESFILARSKGNPFFIEEMVLDMIESGSLVESPLGWSMAANLIPDSLPSSVSGLLHSRIDRLSQELKQSLLRASVLGNDFSENLYKTVCQLLEDNTETELNHLHELQRKGFLLRTELQNGNSFSFHHILIQDVAYSMLLIHNRIILHKCAAEALELDSTTADRGDMAGIIADHWNRAGNLNKAIIWGRKALNYCERNSLMEEGSAVSDKLIQWISKQPGSSFKDNALFEAMLKKEKFLDLLTRREDQEKLLDQLLAMSVEKGEESWNTLVKERLGRMQVFTGKLEQARETLETALQESEYSNNTELRGSLLADMSILCLKQGRKKESLINSMKALKIFRITGNKITECMVLNTIGSAYWTLDNLKKALQFYSAAEKLSHETRNRWYQGNILGNMGIIYRNLGDLEQAEIHYTRAHELHKELGNRLGEAHVLVNLGILESMNGTLDKTKQYYQRALDLYRETDNVLGELQTLGKLGRLSNEQGENEAAEAYFRESLELQKKTGHTGDEAETLNCLANLLRKTGHLDEASAKVESALMITGDIGYPEDRIKSLYLSALISMERGEKAKALEFFQKAKSIPSSVNPCPELEADLHELEERLDIFPSKPV